MQSRPSLKICDRNQDARRILLSDINFTSMVPELSRSADHLALESGVAGVGDSSIITPTVSGLYRNFPRAFSYMKNPDVMLVSPGYQHAREYGRFQWSPCDCVAQGKWEYSPRYQVCFGFLCNLFVQLFILHSTRFFSNLCVFLPNM